MPGKIDDLPVSITAVDLNALTDLHQRIEARLGGMAVSAELKADWARLSGIVNQLTEDFSDLSFMHTTVLEHSSELENALSAKNEELSSLMVKMKKYLSTYLYNLILGGNEEAKSGVYKRKNFVVFFSDIVGFTDITDTLEPELLSGVLNAYLNTMTKIASKWGGTIDKFIGDAIMIFFDPEMAGDDVAESARRCVSMAIEMQSSLGLLREHFEKMGFQHALRIRIGINTGYCTVGNFGADERIDYTLIGGNVNIASRLEHHAPVGGILISASTYILIKHLIRATPKGKIQVKGVSHPIEAYEVIGLLKADEQEAAPMLSLYPDGFELKGIKYDLDQTSTIEREAMVRSLVQALNKLMHS